MISTSSGLIIQDSPSSSLARKLVSSSSAKFASANPRASRRRTPESMKLASHCHSVSVGRRQNIRGTIFSETKSVFIEQQRKSQRHIRVTPCCVPTVGDALYELFLDREARSQPPGCVLRVFVKDRNASRTKNRCQFCYTHRAIVYERCHPSTP